ncbi:MAG: hypothetical protein ABI604_14765 [Nitrospirota bacterium]
MKNNREFHKQSSSHHDSHPNLGGQILKAVRRSNEYDLEELLHVLPGYTWNQVLLEVDRLSRTGELRLLLRGRGLYTVRLSLPAGQSNAAEQGKRLPQTLNTTKETPGE